MKGKARSQESTLKELLLDEEGQGMTEYIIILLLIAVAMIAGWKLFGKKLARLLGFAVEQIGGVEDGVNDIQGEFSGE